MKHLKKYNLFESLSDIDIYTRKYKDIEDLLEKYNIYKYTINDDLSVDVDGMVDLYDKGLTKMPVKFRNASGDFYCNGNKLTSLEGCPEEVSGNFFCGHNQLTSLKYCPASVSGDFSCVANEIVKLDFIPDYVGGDFYIENNPLDPRWIGSSIWDELELDVAQGEIYKD